MAETIDSLEIEINAQATKANNALDKLASKLETLSSSLGKLNVGNLTDLAGGVSSLSTAMQGMQNVKTTDYNRIAKGLDKISSVNVENLTSVANTLNPLATSLQVLSGVQFDNKNITSLINSITRLASVNVGNMQGIEQMGTSLRGLIDNIAGAGNVERTTTSLVNGIARLANAGGKTMLTANALPMLSKSLKDLITNLSTAPQVPAETSALAGAIAKLASAGSKTAATAANLDELSRKLITFIQTLSDAPRVSTNTTQLVTAIANLASTGSNANKAFSNIANMGSRSLSVIRSLASGFKNLLPNINNATKSSKSFISQLGMLYAKAFLVIRMFKQLGKSVTSATDYIEEFNYFNVAMSKIADENKDQYAQYGYDDAESYAESFKTRLTDLTGKMSGFNIDINGELSNSGMKNLGLDVSEITNFESRVAQITNSVGMLGEASVQSSKALTMLSGDLSSLANMDLKQVMDNLSSGMTGMTSAVKKYGMDISVASLKQYALDLGIKKNISSMTQAEKMYLRVIAMLDQSKVAWGDLANTINQPANQFRMLKNNIKATGMMIGKLFLPMIEAVLPYINAMTMAVKDLVQWIGDLFGIKWNNTNIAAPDDNGFDNLEEDANDASNAIDKATDSQKKFNKQLMGFDELNNISKNDSNKDNSGNGTDNSDVSGVLSDALINAVEDYEKRWNKAFDGMTSKADELKQKIEEVFKKDWAASDFTDVGAALGTWIKDGLDNIPWDSLQEGFEKVGKSIGTFINGFVSVEGLGESIGTAIANAINTEEQGIQAGLETTDWDKVGGFIASGVNGVINSDLFPDTARLLGTALNSVFTTLKGFSKELHWDAMGEKIITSLNTFFKTFDAEKNGLTVGEFVSSIATTIYTVVSNKETWKNLGQEIGDGIKGFFEGMNVKDVKTGLNGWEKLGKLISDTISGIATSITTALDTVPWEDVGQAIADFIGAIDFGKVVWNLFEMAKSMLTAFASTIKGFVNNASITDKIGAAIVAVIAVAKLTGASSKISSSLGTVLTTNGLSLGQIAIGLSLGMATFELLDSTDKVNSLVFAPLTAALATLTFTKDIPLALTVAAVTFAWSAGLNVGKKLGEWLFGTDSDWSFADYSLEEWCKGLVDATNDITVRLNLNKGRGWSDTKPEWDGVHDEIVTKRLNIEKEDSVGNVLEKLSNGVIKKTLTVEKDDSVDGWKADWNFYQSGNVLKKLFTSKDKSMDENTTPWRNYSNAIVTKKLFTSKDKSMDENKPEWESFSDNPVVKLLKTSKDKSMDENKPLWLKYSDDTATKTLKAKKDKNFDKNKKSWNKFTSKTIKLDIVTDLVKSAIKQVVSWINTYIIDNLNKLQFKVAGKKIGINIPNITVPKSFETGGFPKKADLFYANENGKPEMIGRMGSRTAVANNDQIVASVSAGVSDAVFNSLAPVLTSLCNSINEMNSNGTALYVEGVSEGDIVKITTDANKSHKKRYGTPLYI